MRRKTLPFASVNELDNLIAQYFTYIEGEYHFETGVKVERSKREVKNSETEKMPAVRRKAENKQKVWDREPEPATIAGLVHYLGFSSRQAFEGCEAKGKYADQLKRARLRVMANYEKKLHATSSSGAIFALKSMGWDERPEPKPADEAANTVFKIEIVQAGPKLASAESEVVL
jgi:hypothetical protein